MNKSLLLLTALSITIAGCKKEEDPETPTPTPTPTNSSFKIDYGFHWGVGDFELANTYTDGNGHAVQFTGVKFYFGEPHLMNGGAEVEHFHDTYFLADATTPDGAFTVGSIDPGTFDMLELAIGLDSATNHADPTTAEAPLNDPTMHWSWNPAAGYKFLLLEGRVDDDGDGVVDATDPEFTYHCATDAALREAALAFSGSVSAGGTLSPHMEIHMDQLVTGVDMLASPMGMGYDPVNIQLMDNLMNALSID